MIEESAFATGPEGVTCDEFILSACRAYRSGGINSVDPALTVVSAIGSVVIPRRPRPNAAERRRVNVVAYRRVVA